MKTCFRSLANGSVSSLTPYQPGMPVETLEREWGITSSFKLSSNENPLGPSPKALQAIQATLLTSHRYPDGGYYDLKQALSEFLSVKPTQITVGHGSENILELIVKSYLHPGDSAVISQYAFLTIPIILQSYGINTIVVPACDFGHDTKAMVNAMDDKTRVLFLVNPNNPTGTYINTTDFQALLKSVPTHVIVVVDEAYSEYISTADCPDALSYLQDFPNLIITRTFSKAYGLAGCRLGYAISSPDVADILNRARLPFNVSSLAAVAGCAALSDDEHIVNTSQMNRQGMKQLEQGLKKLKLTYIPSIANFITVDVGNGLDIYQQLLQAGIIVRPLTAYDMPHHIRVSIGTSDEIDQFLQIMETLL